MCPFAPEERWQGIGGTQVRVETGYQWYPGMSSDQILGYPACTYVITVHTYIHAYVHTYICTYLHTYICTYLHTYIHTCTIDIYYIYGLLILINLRWWNWKSPHQQNTEMRYECLVFSVLFLNFWFEFFLIFYKMNWFLRILLIFFLK